MFLFFFDKKSFNNLLGGATHVHAVDASPSYVCTDKWLQQQIHSAPSVFLTKKKQPAWKTQPAFERNMASPSYAQSKAQMDHPREFIDY